MVLCPTPPLLTDFTSKLSFQYLGFGWDMWTCLNITSVPIVLSVTSALGPCLGPSYWATRSGHALSPKTIFFKVPGWIKSRSFLMVTGRKGQYNIIGNKFLRTQLSLHVYQHTEKCQNVFSNSVSQLSGMTTFQTVHNGGAA